MVIGFYRQNYLTEKTPLTVIMVVTSLTAGSAVLMWIGERITEKGVGNGISIVLTINIISSATEFTVTMMTRKDLHFLHALFWKLSPTLTGSRILSTATIGKAH